jgi:hypothetical protein
MNKFIVLFLFVVSLCLPRGTALGVEARPEDAAQPAAVAWLALVDAGTFAESWEAMSPGFKKKVSKRKWKSTVEEIRKPLGKFSTRKLKSAEYSKELPGAPEGEYVVLHYDSAFERKPAAIEKITLILGRDLNWRVSSYAVK